MTSLYFPSVHPASFRDPSGFLFYSDGILYRQVNRVYRENYDHLIGSGLYKELVEAGLLVPYQEVEQSPAVPENAYKILKPEPVPVISYPYEWCFSQLKDAALTTLRIQKRAVDKDMTLKDASAYNIQFCRGCPIMIDTLSFDRYREGKPWIAYRQFCQHFLIPLALMSSLDIRLGQLLRIYIDGIPLDLASRLLPWRTRLNLRLLLHIHLHAKSQKRYANKQIDKTKLTGGFSKRSMYGLVDNLETAVRNMSLKKDNTEWGDYYETTNYTDDALNHKKELVDCFIELTDAKTVWDFGANTGLYSRIASNRGIPTIAFDIDPIAVEKNYRESLKLKDDCMLPLLLDLTNPSPALGWMCRERENILERGPVDLALALALIHHLAISNNLPFTRIVEFFHAVCRWLIIEFVPKADSQVQRLLNTREDVFNEYTKESFENEFKRYFNIITSSEIKGSERILYLMRGVEI